MSDLLQAAKAVIESLRDLNYENVVNLADLEAAVERAEKPPAGFEKWYESVTVDFCNCEDSASQAWTAAQLAERERILDTIKTISVQGNHDQWFDACDRIMEEIKK